MKKKLIIFSILCMFLSIFFFSISDKEDLNFEKETNKVQEQFASDLINSKELIENLQNEYSNKDIKAILKIKGTDYLTIVPQSTGKENENYYLRRLPNKEYSRLGSTFLDYRSDLNTSNKLLIYGHNFTQHDKGPFKVLENYYDEEYFNNHKYLELITEDGIRQFEIFSIYVATANSASEYKEAFDYYYDFDFESTDDYLSHLNTLKDRSFYKTNVKLTSSDKILILQTCSTKEEYRKNKKKFLLVISKEVELNEKNI